MGKMLGTNPLSPNRNKEEDFYSQPSKKKKKIKNLLFVVTDVRSHLFLAVSFVRLQNSKGEQRREGKGDG